MDGTLIGVSSIHPKRRSLYDKKAEVIALIAFVLIIVLIALICVSLQNKRDSGTADDTRTSAAPSESLEPTPEPYAHSPRSSRPRPRAILTTRCLSVTHAWWAFR